MSAAEALAVYNANAQPARENAAKGLKPTLRHLLFTDSSMGISARSVWLVLFQSVSTQEVGRDVTHDGCTETFLVNDETGEGMWDTITCPPAP
jgi:hypothetical protein